MWNYNKRIEEMSRVELELQEVFDLLHDVKRELKQIRAIADDALLKAQISHSLIVVRKVGEDKVDELKSVLD